MNDSTTLVASRLPSPPKERTTITPKDIIDSGMYSEEQLMCAIEELIINGKSFRAICKEFNISLTALSRWLSSTQHIARTRTATKISADYYADMSIQVLKNAPADKIEIMRAKELSQAYRWMARVRDVSKYGEKLDVTSDGQQVVQVSLGVGIAPPNEVSQDTQETTYIDVTDASNV